MLSSSLLYFSGVEGNLELEPDNSSNDQGINDELITDTCNSDRDIVTRHVQEKNNRC